MLYIYRYSIDNFQIVIAATERLLLLPLAAGTAEIFVHHSLLSEMERHANKFSFRKKDCDKRREKQLQLNASVSFDYDKLSYISKQVAHEIQAELCDEYSFSTDQLAEVAGISCTLVICKVYPKDTLTVSKATLLVVCGPGFNGAVGLVCARYLKTFGYRPTIFFPKRLTNTMFENFNTQCDKLHIPCLSYMPSEATLLTSSYNLIVDALLGCNFQGPISEEFKLIIQTMMKSSLPIVSIDIPSGWDVEKADPEGIQPDVLISLTAPKQCAASFRGKLHFLAGRFLPPDLIQKYDLTIPEYPGTEMCVELLTSVWNASQRRSADEADEVHSPA